MPKTISREAALDLLFVADKSQSEEQPEKDLVFDAFGNYAYPSDIRIKEPNFAVGNASANFYNI